MKTFKLREMSRDELGQRCSELKEELFNLRFASATRSLDNPLRMRIVRREIAKIETILHEEEAGIRGLGVDAGLTDQAGS